MNNVGALAAATLYQRFGSQFVHCPFGSSEQDPQAQQITINLGSQEVIAPDGQRWQFAIEAAPKEMLMEGLDPIALMLKQSDRIERFESNYHHSYPWLA